MTVATGARQQFASISVDGTLDVHAASMVVTRAVAVDAATGQFDLFNAKMVVDYDPAAEASAFTELRTVLKNGYNSGAWDGHGLISSTLAGKSIGFMPSALKFGTNFPATWFGESVDDSTLLVRATAIGDANLDSTVNFSDLLALAANYNFSGRGWWQGDFNYDGAVNFTDLLALASHYGQTVTGSFAGDWAMAVSMAPEPTTLMAFGATRLLLKRRRVS
ncbi:MAG: hypothetical protein QM770_12535 [Tepidisphaeraceae bacterium]